MPVMEDPVITLQNFMKYRKDNIREQSDVVQLFSYGGKKIRKQKNGAKCRFFFFPRLDLMSSCVLEGERSTVAAAGQLSQAGCVL